MTYFPNIQEPKQEQAQKDLSKISKGFPTRYIIKRGKIIKDLKSLCEYCEVDYIDA